MSEMSDAFKNAQWFDACDSETLTHDTWQEAVEEWVEKRLTGPFPMDDDEFERQVRAMCAVSVRAMDPMRFSKSELKGASEEMAEEFLRDYLEERDNPEPPDDHDPTNGNFVLIVAAFRDAIEKAEQLIDVWMCHEVASHSFDFDEVWEIVGEDR